MINEKCDLKGCAYCLVSGECLMKDSKYFTCPIQEALNNPSISKLELMAVNTIINDSLKDVDSELNHVEADDILCEFLEKLGYKRLVDVYRLVDKWYA